jgi:RecF/RecN/SMC N terminal domain
MKFGSSRKRSSEETLEPQIGNDGTDNYNDEGTELEHSESNEFDENVTPAIKKSKTKGKGASVIDEYEESTNEKENVFPSNGTGYSKESHDSNENISPNQTDDAFDDSEEVAPDEEVPTSAQSARGRKEKTSQQHSEAGIIKQIYVENFMCHRKLRVDLNRNVNFISGQNGSGKSAILAAIQICLGASARRTHRARNLKDLVRKDATTNPPTSAKVRVTLLNKENDGFQYETYGDTITVERCISLNGGYNGYKLLDHNLKEQSRSKKDLDEMLDTL